MNAPSQTLIWNPEIEWSELRSLSPFSLYACLRTFLVCVSVRVWPWNNAKTVGRENCLRNSGTTHHQNANVILISLFYLDASPITLLSAWNIIIEFCFRITDYLMLIQFRSTTGTNNHISVFVCCSEPSVRSSKIKPSEPCGSRLLRGKMTSNDKLFDPSKGFRAGVSKSMT